MKNIGSVAVYVFAIFLTSASAQQKTEKHPSLAQLELTAEIAATTDDGLPAALRITIKNAGSLVVDMPLSPFSCYPSGGVSVEFFWHSNQDNTGEVHGHGCGGGKSQPLTERVPEDWIRLRPGEFVTSTENLRSLFRNLKPGVVEYWVEYTPPDATPKEILALQELGYIIPTENLATAHKHFDIP